MTPATPSGGFRARLQTDLRAALVVLIVCSGALTITQTSSNAQAILFEGATFERWAAEGDVHPYEAVLTAGDFLEHADYAGRRYGTLRSEVERRLADGVSVVLEIEVQGARQVAKAMPEAKRIFIAPPSEDELRLRLVGRGTDDEEERKRRLETAKSELAAQDEFDIVVTNDRLSDAAAELERIVTSAL